MSELDTAWVARWAVALCEPLLTTADRIEIDDRMRELVAARPHWFSAWLSGFLSGLVRSLDPQDPWRNLTVADGKVLHPNETPFGSYVDATDLVHVSVPDLRSDLGLAALATPLDDTASRLIAEAARGWDDMLHWCEQNIVSAAQLSAEAGANYFDSAAQAVRWIIHRRRLFFGLEDPFIPVSAVAWIHRADKLTSGESWDEARAARHEEASKVDPGSYQNFT